MLSEKGRVSRKVLLGMLLIAIFAVYTFGYEARANPLGWWEKHTYTQTIPRGHALYHQYQHQGAVYGSSHLISSSGKASLTYLWDAPWLYTNIDNLDDKDITVTWEEDFYVV